MVFSHVFFLLFCFSLLLFAMLLFPLELFGFFSSFSLNHCLNPIQQLQFYKKQKRKQKENKGGCFKRLYERLQWYCWKRERGEEGMFNGDMEERGECSMGRKVRRGKREQTPIDKGGFKCPRNRTQCQCRRRPCQDRRRPPGSLCPKRHRTFGEHGPRPTCI